MVPLFSLDREIGTFCIGRFCLESPLMVAWARSAMQGGLVAALSNCPFCHFARSPRIHVRSSILSSAGGILLWQENVICHPHDCGILKLLVSIFYTVTQWQSPKPVILWPLRRHIKTLKHDMPAPILEHSCLHWLLWIRTETITDLTSLCLALCLTGGWYLAS